MSRSDHAEYVAATRLIHKGPCIVKNVNVCYTGATYQWATIYDGENAKGELKAKILASVYSNGDWTPGEGTDFENGIYVVCGATITVTVTYAPESRKAFL